MTLQDAFVKNLKKQVEYRGITAFFQKAGIPKTNYWNWTSYRQSPSLRTIQRLAKALKIDPLELLR